MCGPIAFALPLSRDNMPRMTLQIVLYHTGRLMTYSLIGILFGLFGKGLYLAGFQQRLSILVGILMILFILFPSGKFQKINILKPLYGFMGTIKSRLGHYLKLRSLPSFFLIGFFNGFLPCGLVYIAVFGSLATGSPEQGGLYMFMFGLGTVLLMSAAAIFGNFVNISFRNKIQKAIPIFVLIIGVLFILRGLGLGIPYISPSDVKLNVSNNPTECVNVNPE
jgi:sulfite exporter TauE/SafE